MAEPRPAPGRLARTPFPSPGTVSPCPGADAHAALLGSLAGRIDEVLRPLVPADRPVALLDSPLTPNVGDSMIWLGALSYLASRGIRPCYTCDLRTFSPGTLRRRIGGGTILLSGGGNFGDLYPPHQEFREAVVARFPGNRIVQLPQSIFFQSPEALTGARQVLDRHPDLTLLTRDASSLALAGRSFRAPSLLCPDISFALGAQSRPCPPSHPVVWLARRDKEAREPLAPAPAGVLRVDWVEDDATLLVRSHRRLTRILSHHSGLRAPLGDALARASDAVARARVERGSRLLSSGRVVITSRLHGHVLCMLLGIRHIMLDNSYGKVRGAYETWTHASPLAELALSQADALARAAALTAAAREA